jgi:predicted transcriptional regulator
MAYTFLLEKVLEEIDQTRNAVAVEAKVRPATLQDLYYGNTKRIELESFERILNTINKFAAEKGIEKTYTIDDIIKYNFGAQ